MVTVRFQEIKLHGIRRWKDADGKRRQETKVFSQTLNPFNKNAAGIPKSSSEIWDELRAEAKAWKEVTW